jgi:NAD(P)-dependent dehydrogenase (short-subunit alcohol dehydrogenase family)
MVNIVIGAGSGMGVAIARKLAPLGPLVIADYNLAGVESLAAEIGSDVRAARCDISNQADVDALFASVKTLDALVVTAGLSGSQAPGRRILEVNLIGYERVLRAAEPLLQKGSVGVIFASQSGYMVPDLPDMFKVVDNPLDPAFFEKLGAFFDFEQASFAYQLSKRGVHRMARRWAKTWGQKGARILSLSPGINDTPMNRADEAKNPIMQEMIKAAPLGRRGTTGEIANVTAFLISDQASLMTGSDVLVDGGMSTILPSNVWEGVIRPSRAP